MRLKFRFVRLLDFLLRRLHLHRQEKMSCMIEEVANDFRCERYLRECISDSYLSVFLMIHAQLVNAALLDNEECDDDDLCTECFELDTITSDATSDDTCKCNNCDCACDEDRCDLCQCVLHECEN